MSNWLEPYLIKDQNDLTPFPYEWRDTKWKNALINRDNMITKTFVISLDKPAAFLLNGLVELLGYRGIMLDPKPISNLVYTTAADMLNNVIRAIDPKNQFRDQSSTTAVVVQGLADALAYTVNSYGVGKTITDFEALNLINGLEREIIAHMSSVLPDIDNDDVSILSHTRITLLDYAVTLKYPVYYESAN